MRAFVISRSITNRDEKSLEKYLSDISKYDVLTPDEEVELFQEYQSGSEAAFSRIITHNLRFVVSVAKKYQNMGLALTDLINEGNLGLIKAARRFDLSKGFKFISYAVWWIRQSILQALNDRGRNIRIPLNVTGNMSKVKKMSTEFLQREEREPTLEELAAATGLTKVAVERCVKHYRKCSSLDAPVKEDSNATLATMIEDKSTPEPDHEVSVLETQRIDVKRLLDKLPDREATVLSMFYGIGRPYQVSLADISETIGLSKERVRQIKDRAISKLRVRSSNLSHVATFSEN